MNSVTPARIRTGNTGPVRQDADYVLYWMTAYRRTSWNFSLDRAIQWAKTLNKPLLVLEALRCDYQWACDRFHRFILDGMRDNLLALSKSTISYYPYVEPEPSAGKGLLTAFADRACVLVTDDFPAFFLPRMIAAAAKRVKISMELVDSNGLLPMHEAQKTFQTAHSFRSFLQKTLPSHFLDFPEPQPLVGLDLPTKVELPINITSRWSRATSTDLAGRSDFMTRLPINHEVSPARIPGGHSAALRALNAFLRERLSVYEDRHNEPEANVTSGLSPYLHWGQISVHEIFSALIQLEDWSPVEINVKSGGNRRGWWGMSRNTEAFLDELITWRELGFNMCYREHNYDQYDSLPVWAKQTLAGHEKDIREYIYTLADFDAAQTHDLLWNACQRELVREGKIHNYLRMLWGKKILEWTRSPAGAASIMIELNNKYALDGRDPNSYSGIFWVMGRYDRPWGPERPVFGKVRYMSSENTKRKYHVLNYLDRYGP